MKILPGTGRWQSEGLTEGPVEAGLDLFAISQAAPDPSTAKWRFPSPFRGGFILELLQ
jgi:hypothetical protein